MTRGTHFYATVALPFQLGVNIHRQGLDHLLELLAPVDLLGHNPGLQNLGAR